MRIEDFYRSLKGNVYDNLISIGHFDIIKVEDLRTDQGKSADYLRRSYYKVSLVYGHSKIHYPDQSFEINGAALVFTNPQIPYKWERISQDQRGYVCIFTRDFLSGLGNPDDFVVYKPGDCGVIPLDDDLAGKFENTFIEMSEELEGTYRLKYDLLKYRLMEILHQGQKHAPHSAQLLIGSNANERISFLFLELLEQQFPIENSTVKVLHSSPGEFADQLHIHVNHLNKALKEITGRSTSALINDRFMLEAKNLLKGTRWAVSKIAWVLGFEEPNHFSTFFKRHQGIKPNEFRNISD